MTQNPALGYPEPPRLSLQALGLMVLGFLFVTGFLMRARPDWIRTIVWMLKGDGCSQSASNERNASSSLKTISSAQADFRANDRDADDVHQFWRADIAGLYVLTPLKSDTREAIKLIEQSVAAADDRPHLDITRFAVRSPKAGYWFRALLHEEEQTPDPQRFAACAFPDSPSSGKRTYIIDENNTIFWKDLGTQRGIERFPLDPFRAGWQKYY